MSRIFGDMRQIGIVVRDIDKAMIFYRRLFGNDLLKDSRTPRRYLLCVAKSASAPGIRGFPGIPPSLHSRRVELEAHRLKAVGLDLED